MPTLIDDRDVALKNAGDIVNSAKSASRELTADENALVKGYLETVDSLNQRIATGQESAELIKRLGQVGQKETPSQATFDAPTLGEHFVKSGTLDSFRSGIGQRSASAPEFKAAGDPFVVGSNGTTQYGPVIQTRLRRLTVAELMQTGRLSASSLTYSTQGTVTGSPTAVSENGQKPSMNFAFSPVTEALSKIAAITKVSTESMEDTEYIVSVINSQLVQRLQIVEEDQLLNGNGTAPNLRGLLNRSGIQTYGAVTDLASGNLDKIYHAMTLVSNGSSPFPPDAVVINPVDYEKMRLAKDGDGQYYAGGPFTGAYGNGGLQLNPGLWGLNTVVTPAIAAGTTLVGAFNAAAQVFRKGGIQVDSTNSDSDDFQYNRVALRAEERILLAVYYASAFVKVTLGAA